MNDEQEYLLVVEDDPDILKLLETTLSFKGYRVVIAHNGREAIDIILREHPALVIADIMMPELDGFGMAHRLRISPDTSNIPVVFITATFVALEDREFALSLGAARFIRKPIDLDKFLTTIEELLEESSSAGLAPLHESSFYTGYRSRLVTKLGQKDLQIARDQALLGLQPDNKDPRLEASIRQAKRERQEIAALIQQIDEQLRHNSEPENSHPAP
jgi:DNA-binding response OmpR family regulator